MPGVVDRRDSRFPAVPVSVREFETVVKPPAEKFMIWAAVTDFVRLLNVVLPEIVCPVGPTKATVLVAGAKVPPFDQLPLRVSVFEESVSVLPEPIETPPATFIGPEKLPRFHDTVPPPEVPTPSDPLTVSVLDPVPPNDASPDVLSKLKLP